jgi:hypothetical protein
MPIGPNEKDSAPPAPSEGDQHRGEPAHPGVPLAPPGIVPESDVRLHTPWAAAPLPSHGHVNEGLGELPSGYFDGRLVGLVRDPATLFVYWDFSPQQIEQAFAGLGGSRAVIKLVQPKEGAGEVVREEEVHLDARGWYLRDLPPAVELRIEVWAVGDRGARMLRAARPLRLPPSSPSETTAAFYLSLPLDHPLPSGGVPPGQPHDPGGGAPAGWERRLQPRPFSGSSFGAKGTAPDGEKK